jgi:two-component system, LytTR family, response regulator
MPQEQTLFKALIVDDEPVARRGIRRLLDNEVDFVVVGECRNGDEALESLRRLQPDLVFLDVQMPKMNGFETLRKLEPDRAPAVIFVTAYDEYTLDAFDVHALDYLLKPVDPIRFQKAVARAREHLRNRDLAQVREQLHALLTKLEEPKPIDRLAVKLQERIIFLETRDIDWIEAEDNYVRLHTRGQSYLLHETMAAMEKKLDPAVFRRIHRSRIVNHRKIKELRPLFHGEYLVILQDGSELTSGRSFREHIQSILGE